MYSWMSRTNSLAKFHVSKKGRRLPGCNMIRPEFAIKTNVFKCVEGGYLCEHSATNTASNSKYYNALDFPSIRIYKNEVMEELREIKLLCFHFSIISFANENYPNSSLDLIPRPIAVSFPVSPFHVLKIANQNNLLSFQHSAEVSGNKVQSFFLSANFLDISMRKFQLRIHDSLHFMIEKTKPPHNCCSPRLPLGTGLTSFQSYHCIT